ncbi:MULTISPECIES: hypothetical protein [unclassified Bradyrhizobium]
MTRHWPDWSGETAVIVASGPSALSVPLARMRGCARFIAINESWRLCPWADVLYACDGAWWRAARGAPGFLGLKITDEARAAEEFDLVKVKVCRGCDVILTGMTGLVGDGGNSGFQALNLAIQWGARRILLVGFDMTLARGEHWHGRHGAGLNNPRPNNVHRWLSARWSTPLGVEIINCSPGSALTAYPTKQFQEVSVY